MRNGPTPGIVSAPIPANQPSAPPTTAPDPAPVTAPSGAFVAFSVASACAPRFSESKTETSVLRNPASFNFVIAPLDACPVGINAEHHFILSSHCAPPRHAA